VKKSIVVSAGPVVAVSPFMALFGTGVAAADGYAGQTYTDASSLASGAGLSVVVAGRVGDKLSQGDCVVSRSQTAPFASANDGARVDRQVQFYLNCNGRYASATTPGNSLASPEGREAKAAAGDAAAQQQQSLEEVSSSTPG
jgi:hypothetical protein